MSVKGHAINMQLTEQTQTEVRGKTEIVKCFKLLKRASSFLDAKVQDLRFHGHDDSDKNF